MSAAQEIKSRLDIVDVVSEYMDLRKSGRNYTGFCPFHANTRTPAFYVSPERQSWRCFGACAEGGDVISYVMKKEGWDFKEALAHLARRTGVELQEFKPKNKVQQAFEDKLGDLLESAATYFNQLFLYAPEAQAARDYVERREISAETIAEFNLGFALNSWDACRSHFSGQGYTQQELIEAGLLTYNEDKGSAYDRFRNRLIFPIRNPDGKVVGFGARTLEPDGIPKYLNSSQNELFDKSRLLYGLSQAKKHIREARHAVVVEGYMDVIRAHQAGFRNVVAQMGTALTETQLKLLKRSTSRLIIALDADEAGANAMLRGLRTASQATEQSSSDIQGLLRLEGPLKLEIKTVTLPDGKDPDDIIRENPALWPQLLTQAQSLGDYVIKTLTRDVDLSDSKRKSAVAREIIPYLDSISDPVERDHFMQVLARTLQINEAALRRLRPPRKRAAKAAVKVEKKLNGGRVSAELNKKIVAPLATAQHEANYLCQCLTYPIIINAVNSRLKAKNQPHVSAGDFSSSEDQALWHYIDQWAEQSRTATIESLQDSLDSALDSRVQRLLTLPAIEASKQDQLPDRLALSVLNWRLDKVKNMLTEIKYLLADSQKDGDDEASNMHRSKMQELSLMMLSINQARYAMSSASQR